MEQRNDELSRRDVARILHNFVHGKGDSYEWDDFLYERFKDKELDSIRQLCGLLSYTHPPESAHGYCSKEGMRIIQEIGERLSSDS